MNHIKTRSIIKKTKVLDRAADLTHRAKNAFIRSKEQSDQPHQSTNDNYVEFAGEKVKVGSQTSVYKVGQAVHLQGKSVIERTLRNVAKRGSARSEARYAAQGGGKSTKEATKGTVKTANRSIKTASSTAKATIKTSCAVGKTATKTAQVTVKAAQRAAQAARMAVKAAITAAKLLVKAIIAAVKAAISAIKGLVSLIAAGGWVAVVVIIVIALVAFLLSSPMGIFTGGGTDNTPTISELIQDLNADLTDNITQIKRDAESVDKVEIIFNIEGSTFIDNWPDILAVFAVQTNMDPENPMDVIVMDEQRITQLRKVFWDMNRVSSSITETTPTASTTLTKSPDSTAAPVPVRILTINVDSKYWEDMIGVYSFTDDQINMLKQLMSAKYAAMLMQLIDSATGSPATDWSGVIDVPDGGMDIPLYLQGDFKQTVCYIDGVAKSVKSSGCGATCVSMVIAYLTGNINQTPYTLFKWAYENGYYSGGGLGHSCLTKLAGRYGVKGTWIENDEVKIAEALRAGHPVIAHMGPGLFTTEGHYIVLRGITEDGYVLLNDPGNKNRNRYAYLLSTVVKQARTSNSFMVCCIDNQ